MVVGHHHFRKPPFIDLQASFFLEIRKKERKQDMILVPPWCLSARTLAHQSLLPKLTRPFSSRKLSNIMNNM